MPDSAVPDDTLRAALHGVRALLLDLDGVLIVKGAAVPGAAAALAELDAAAVPVPRGDQHVARLARARWPGGGGASGFATPAERFQSALSASADMVRREYGDRPVYVITSDDARVEFEGVNVVDGAAADAAPGERGRRRAGGLARPADQGEPGPGVPAGPRRGGADRDAPQRRGGSRRTGPTLDAGAFLVGLEYATEQRARIVGKPSLESFRLGFERLAAEARERGEPRLLRREVAMVGDDVFIDVGGAPAGRAARHLRPDRQARRRGACGRRGSSPGCRAPGWRRRVHRGGRRGAGAEPGSARSARRARHPHVVHAGLDRGVRAAVHRLEAEPDRLAGPGVHRDRRRVRQPPATTAPDPVRSQTTVCVPSAVSTIARRWSADVPLAV